MVDAFTPLLRIRLPEVGAKENLWAPPTTAGLNDGVVDMLDEAMAAVVDLDVTGGNIVLTASNGISDNSRPMFLSASGTPGVPRDITVADPPVQKIYIIENNSDDVVTLRTVTNAGVDVNPGNRLLCYVDSVLDDVFAITFTGDLVLEAPAWTTGTLDILDRTAGDSQVTYRYSLQGKHLLFQIPEFSTTLSRGLPIITRNLIPNTPAAIPAEAVPAFVQSSMAYVVQAGVVTPVQFSFGFDNAILIYRADGAPWAAGTVTFILPHNITMTMNVQGF